MNENIVKIKIVADDLASGAFKSLNTSLGSIGGGIKNFAGTLATGAAQLTKLTLGMGAAAAVAGGSLFFALGKAGGNLERLKVSTEILGRNVGITTDEIDKMVEELEATNTFGSNAYNAINTLVRSGLVPMVKNLKIQNKELGINRTGMDAFIKTAKDLAAAAGVSSGQGIELMTKAIQQQRPELLETLGVNLNMVRVYKDYADSVGKTRTELSQQEEQTALLNAVIEEGTKVIGTYDATYETAGKNLLSIQDAFKSTTEVIGLELQPAFVVVTGKVLELIKNFRTLVKDNKELIRQFAERLANALETVFQKISSIAREVQTRLTPRFNDIKDFIEANSEKIASFAETFGKITGAVIAVTLAVWGLNVALGILTSPVTILIGIIAALTFAYEENFLGLKDFVDNLIPKVVGAWESFKNKLEEFKNSAAVRFIVNELGPVIAVAIEEARENVKELVTVFNQELRPSIEELYTELKPLLKVIATLAFVAFVVFIKNAIKVSVVISKILVKYVTEAMSSLTNFYNAIVDIKNAVSDLIEELTKLAKEKLNVPAPASLGFVGQRLGFANGADFVVPPGFPNDSFGPMFAQSGERVQVTPAGQTSSGNGQNIVINNNFNNTTNPEQISSRIGFQLRTL